MKSYSKKILISFVIALSIVFLSLFLGSQVSNADTPIASIEPETLNLNESRDTAYVGYTANNYASVFYIRVNGTENILYDDDHRKVEFTSGDVSSFNISLTGGTMNPPSSWDGGTIVPANNLPAGTYQATYTLFYDENGTASDWTEICSGTVSFTVNKCTVTLDPNNGTEETDSIEANISSVTIANPSDYGFTIPSDKEFDGWLIGENKYSVGEEITITSNVTAVAQWKDIEAAPDTPAITTWAELQSALNAGGTVTLTQDIVAESTDTTLSIPRPAVLDLNGCIIDAKGYFAPVIRLSENSNLVIDDSNPNKEHSPAFTYKNPITNDDVVVNGGIITGGKDGNWGNGIDVPRSTLTINAGSIVGNTTTTGNGAGVFLHSGATCTMNGGLIAGNYSAGSGGGVYLYYSNTFYMTGGSIKHNSADGKGGGVYLWNNQTGYYETLNMSGGSIEENKATSGGGGIYVDTRGVLNVSGNPVIIGNKSGDAKSNVYSGLNVTGPLTDGANIGITTQYVPWAGDFNLFTNGYGTYNTIDPAQYFVSDYDNVAVVARENYNGIVEAALTLNYSVTVTSDGNGTASANISKGIQGTEVTLTATPNDSLNYRFKEWQVISGGITINDNKFNIGSSDVEVKAIFEEIPYYTVSFMDGTNTLFTQRVKSGEHATEPTTNPSKEGYTFIRWCIDQTTTTRFIFEDNAITSDTPIYADWKLLPNIKGESIWRKNSDNALLKFYSNVDGTFYYLASSSSTAPTANDIKTASTGEYGNASTTIGTNTIDVYGLSSGPQYVYVVVEQDNVFSNVLKLEMPYDSYLSDNFDGYSADTRISGFNSYTLRYDGTGSGNQKVISTEQKDGSTGNVLQLQGSNSWASDVRHSLILDDNKYVVFEANMKPVSGIDPGGFSFGSSSAEGRWTNAICGASMHLNNMYYYRMGDPVTVCDTELRHSNGNWYNLKMILDNTSDFYYICVDNTFINTIQYDAQSPTPEWISIGAGNNGTNTIYYDDLKIYTTNTIDIPEPSYKITVNNGVSDITPRATEGTTVTITANEVTNGSQFYKWKVVSGGVTLADETSATTTFTMGSENVEVSALYKYTIDGQIQYELHDSYGDGWHSNNYLNIVDSSNGIVVESLTVPSGYGKDGVTTNLEYGHIYDLYWQKGSWPGECYYTLKDEDGNEILSRTGNDCNTQEGYFVSIEVITPTLYTVKYMSGGSEISSNQVKAGRYITAPTTNPTREGYTFFGWCSNENLSSSFDFSQPINDNTTIYAGFNGDKYTDNTVDESESTIISKVVTTNLVDGSENTTTTYNETISVPYSTPKTDDVQTHINSSKSAAETFITNNNYINKESQSETTESDSADNRRYYTETAYSSTDYAIMNNHIASGNYYRKTTYTTTYFADIPRPVHLVRFNPNGGEVDPYIIEVGEGLAIGELPTPTRKGYNFKGWFLNDYYSLNYQDAFYDDYFNRNVVRLAPGSPTSNGLFHEGYRVQFDVTILNTTPISVDINDNDLISGVDYTIEGNRIYGAVTISSEHYRKWGGNSYSFLDINCEAPVTSYRVDEFKVFKDVPSTSQITAETIMRSDDIDAIASWEPRINTVSFNTDGGSSVESQSVTTGNKVTEPATPSKDGYGFAGWYTDTTLSTKFDFNTIIDSDVIIYAKWGEYHNAVLTLTDGSNVADIEMTDEQELIIEGLFEKGLLVPEADETETIMNFYNEDGKLLFSYGEDGIIIFADDTTYKDNIEYTLTDDERAALARDGIFVDKIVLSFGSGPVEYIILEGADQTYIKGSGINLSVKANGLLKKLVEIRKNNKKIADTDVVLTSGSTIATLSSTYLDSLDVGTYKLTFLYNDGEASTSFTIAEAAPATVSEAVAGAITNVFASPVTGDNIVVWIVLLAISLNGIIATKTYIKKVLKKK